jgi:MOSC domain-containing protein YiiM
MPPKVLSVNVGHARVSSHTNARTTGIDKRPIAGAVAIRDPRPYGPGGSGLVGDAVCDTRYHGGSDQAVYAYAREDLDRWENDLGRTLACGVFGENLTTTGIDVTAALIGEQWRIGEDCVLQVTRPRTPCRTFARWLDEHDWIQRFAERCAPGAYLRVVVPGFVRAGDDLRVVDRPDHEVTIGLVFQALGGQRHLLPALLQAGDTLPEDIRGDALRFLRRPDPDGATS